MKKYLILLFFYSICSYSQIDSNDLNQNVTGIITTGDDTYLILEEGFIQINKIDIYTEYYRQIYNDSTIINPNLELKEDFNFNIIPYISPDLEQYKFDFNQPINLGVFLQPKGTGQFYLTPFTEEIIDSLNKK